MSGAAAPSDWRLARIASRHPETPRAATIRLAVEAWPGHVAGQRIDVRLTAEDGYQATRSYSIASAPSAGVVDLTVERIDDGEVSPYLVDVTEPGDLLEVRGPIGGWFTWRPATVGPLVLLGGGSGLVPLVAMVREAVAAGHAGPVRLLASTRTRSDLLFAGELALLHEAGALELVHTLTREQPAGWRGPTGRVSTPLVERLLSGLAAPPAVYVCGPNGFVEAASEGLLDAGVPASKIRTERFGPSA